MGEVALACAIFFIITAHNARRALAGTLLGKVMLKNSPWKLLISLLDISGGVASISLIVVSFLLFPWWLVIAIWLAVSVLATPLVIRVRNPEVAMPVFPLAQAIVTIVTVLFYFHFFGLIDFLDAASE